ncbi:MAG TPA: acyl-CoA dehydrogenase family protein [Steroidobacteraceae bacterium]|nr:acyl-CoA dehydrogenase family protein [Steroidobacteraceae bacterium]
MIALTEAFSRAIIPAIAEDFRAQVKSFLGAALPGQPPHVRARTWSAFDAKFSRSLAERGWLGLTLPKRYGGAGLDAFSRFVLVEELLVAGAPVAAHWIGDRQSAPLILRYGTEEQRQFYLPRICRAEIFFCIGMSEPNAGSDLASVRTKATRTDTGWLLNGSKVWTTYAHKSHYMLALVRTSGTADDRQQGLSQFVIDLSLPGISIKPIMDLCGDEHFSEVFFQDVQLSADALVGEAGQGWAQTNAELAFERSGPERIYSSLILLDLWTHRVCRASSEPHEVRLGRLIARLAVLREMCLAITQRLANGDSPLLEAALLKDLGTEFEQSIPQEIADAVAADPDAQPDDELTRTLAYLMQISPAFSLRGGTREILRGMIARGLGLR